MELLLKIISSICVLVVVLFSISLIPMGVYIKHASMGLDIQFKLGLLRIPIVSTKHKNKKSKKSLEVKQKKDGKLKKSKKNQPGDQKKKKRHKSDAKKQAEKEPVTPKKIKGSVPKMEELLQFVVLIQACVSLLLEALEAFGVAKRVRLLELDLVIGDSDPVKATMMYGQAHALLGTIWIPLDEGLDIEEGRARVSLMYEEVSPALYGTLDTTITIGKLVRLSLFIGKKGYHLIKNK